MSPPKITVIVSDYGETQSSPCCWSVFRISKCRIVCSHSLLILRIRAYLNLAFEDIFQYFHVVRWRFWTSVLERSLSFFCFILSFGLSSSLHIPCVYTIVWKFGDWNYHEQAQFINAYGILLTLTRSPFDFGYFYLYVKAFFERFYIKNSCFLFFQFKLPYFHEMTCV